MNATSTETTTVVSTYSNRSAAESARARLEAHGIDAFVTADNAHTTFQETEGVALRTLETNAARARALLNDTPEGASAGTPPTHARSVQATAWLSIAAFVLMVALIVGGLIMGV